MKVFILSDTHGWLDPAIIRYLQQADTVWHAGDLGPQVWPQLQQHSHNLHAVYGNIDDHQTREELPEYDIFEAGGLRVLLIHIAGSLPRYNRQVLKLINRHRPGMLVCGHSHILKVAPDKTHNLLYVNPGAAGNQGFHKVRTCLQLEISRGKPRQMQVIELGKRGRNKTAATLSDS